MSAPALPGAVASPSSQTGAPAAQRAREIQDALKSIVLQTASTLRAKTQLARLQSSIPPSSSTAAADVSAVSSGLDQLTGECTRYLSLVHGLRDYLLHAQAALEIELEAATQREAEESKRAAEAAAEALKKQQQAEAEAKKKAKVEEERKKKKDEEKAKAQPAEESKKEDLTETGDGKKDSGADDSFSGLTTPPLPPAKSEGAEMKPGSNEAKKKDPGKAANDAIVIDSDGDDDEDDVPLAFAPKAGAAEGSSKAIDLTESPALANAAKPLPSDTNSTSVPASIATDAAAATTTTTTTTQDPTPSTSTDTAAAGGIQGLDLSAFGINLSSLGNFADLSSLGIPSLNTASSSTDTSNPLVPATDFSELEKMMGMDFSSANNTTSSATGDTNTGAQDFSSLGNYNLGSLGGNTGFGDDNDLFGAGSGGIDLSQYDFSSLGGSGDAGAGGVDLRRS
ncbi:hypothetical protein NDA11_007323 [Ustilago hordei]|uniref:Uncharacterized protein n=1 Tax=Ustilago hordei TaxID=120017 RepID=I2G1L4_USTHO|nr:uncharacterized protein UHO2_02473 [Ustilago hordei]KAJ1040139.1 hypothetical protein NDA10_007048 [Ustilago hordei]KAJ1593327.1 hypothetical protein NDA11_007323 [Ustilago hordei]KAJ1601403.1 hypothetical protein NDA14_002175 [Ustilago hordei]CCF53057.1 uncharacterized protein UHOR_02843 [Ustilago hordei]SYW77665.1 uncharacterized protein UHO2_02473 [Ustilago hordei]